MRLRPWLSAAAVFGLLLAVEAGRGIAYTESQYERGLRIYQTSCIKCHGINGEGDPDSGVPAHKGGKILDDFKTIAQMAAFIKAAMPADNPGSLSIEDAYAVSARIMALNGWQPDGVEINAETAPTLTLRGAPAQPAPAPAQPAPAQPAPSQPAPAQPTPSQPAPAQPAPSQPAPAQPAPSQPAPAQPAPSQPAPAQPAPAQPAPAQPAPSQPAPSQPAPAQPAADQPDPSDPSNRAQAPPYNGVSWALFGAAAVLASIGVILWRRRRVG